MPIRSNWDQILHAGGDPRAISVKTPEEELRQRVLAAATPAQGQRPTLDDYLARMSPYLPKQQAPVQVPQAQGINPLQLMVAQQLMSALQPQRSVTPKVPKNSMWITPQMIQGAAQTNVAEQRLGQEDQAMAQSQMAQMLQNQMAQERMNIDQSQFQQQQEQATALAQYHTVGQILASQAAADRQAEYNTQILQRQKDLLAERARLKAEDPATALQTELTEARIRAANRSGAGGAGGGLQLRQGEGFSVWDPKTRTLVPIEPQAPEQKPTGPLEAIYNALTGRGQPKKSTKQKQAAATLKGTELRNKQLETSMQKTGYGGMSNNEIQQAHAAQVRIYYGMPPSEGTPERAVYDSLNAEWLKRFGNAGTGAAPGASAGGAVPGEESYAERRKRLGR